MEANWSSPEANRAGKSSGTVQSIHDTDSNDGDFDFDMGFGIPLVSENLTRVKPVDINLDAVFDDAMDQAIPVTTIQDDASDVSKKRRSISASREVGNDVKVASGQRRGRQSMPRGRGHRQSITRGRGRARIEADRGWQSNDYPGPPVDSQMFSSGLMDNMSPDMIGHVPQYPTHTDGNGQMQHIPWQNCVPVGRFAPPELQYPPYLASQQAAGDHGLFAYYGGGAAGPPEHSNWQNEWQRVQPMNWVQYQEEQCVLKQMYDQRVWNQAQQGFEPAMLPDGAMVPDAAMVPRPAPAPGPRPKNALEQTSNPVFSNSMVGNPVFEDNLSTMNAIEPNSKSEGMNRNSSKNYEISSSSKGRVGTGTESMESLMTSMRGNDIRYEAPMDKRADRNLREQVRSLKISKQIYELQSILDEKDESKKGNKYAILEGVQQYILQMKDKVAFLEKELKQKEILMNAVTSPASEDGPKGALSFQNFEDDGTASSNITMSSNVTESSTVGTESRSPASSSSASTSSTNGANLATVSVSASTSTTVSKDAAATASSSVTSSVVSSHGRNPHLVQSTFSAFSSSSPPTSSSVSVASSTMSGDSKYSAPGIPGNFFIPTEVNIRDGNNAWLQLSTQAPSEAQSIVSPVERSIQFSQLFASIPSPLALTTSSGKIVDCNEQFERICGLGRNVILRLTIFNLIESSSLHHGFTEMSRVLHSPPGNSSRDSDEISSPAKSSARFACKCRARVRKPQDGSKDGDQIDLIVHLVSGDKKNACYFVVSFVEGTSVTE
jgi:hypothetical protein